MRDLLKKEGYKVTPARLSILEVLDRSKIPLTAEMIYKKLKKSEIDQATVYRTVSTFEKDGILRKVYLGEDSSYFELNSEHHHHMVCTNCNKVEDFRNQEIEKILKHIVEKSAKFKNIKEHSLELFGLCRICA